MRELSNRLYGLIPDKNMGVFRLVDHKRNKSTLWYTGMESQDTYKKLARAFRNDRKAFNFLMHKEIWGE